VHVGLGKKEPHWISDLLQQKQRIQSGPTAPPDGLYLVNVKYET
jgi:tRNA pseudouridine38-40 synthase